jgi:hypothetical protein
LLDYLFESFTRKKKTSENSLPAFVKQPVVVWWCEVIKSMTADDSCLCLTILLESFTRKKTADNSLLRLAAIVKQPVFGVVCGRSSNP